MNKSNLVSICWMIRNQEYFQYNDAVDVAKVYSHRISPNLVRYGTNRLQILQQQRLWAISPNYKPQWMVNHYSLCSELLQKFIVNSNRSKYKSVFTKIKRGMSWRGVSKIFKVLHRWMFLLITQGEQQRSRQRRKYRNSNTFIPGLELTVAVLLCISAISFLAWKHSTKKFNIPMWIERRVDI